MNVCVYVCIWIYICIGLLKWEGLGVELVYLGIKFFFLNIMFYEKELGNFVKLIDFWVRVGKV